jgi:succinate dehydrogenase / fumarate reductase cytochrome b subunit
MNWKQAFTSSIGKKLVMAITGVSLIGFLVVHCYVNGLIFLEWLGPPGRGYKAYEGAAHFLGSNPLTRMAEIGLLGGILLHIIQGLMLTAQNKSKRPVSYEVNPGNKNSKWYSRSMGLLGTIILLFLIVHFAHFWAPNRYQQLMEGREKDLYLEMEVVFSQWYNVVIYILGCLSLAYHLLHGFWSAFQTLGVSTKKYTSIIRCLGTIFSIVVPAIFILMPLAYYFGWLPSAEEAKAAAAAMGGH